LSFSKAIFCSFLSYVAEVDLRASSSTPLFPSSPKCYVRSDKKNRYSRSYTCLRREVVIHDKKEEKIKMRYDERINANHK